MKAKTSSGKRRPRAFSVTAGRARRARRAAPLRQQRLQSVACASASLSSGAITASVDSQSVQLLNTERGRRSAVPAGSPAQCRAKLDGSGIETPRVAAASGSQWRVEAGCALRRGRESKPSSRNARAGFHLLAAPRSQHGRRVGSKPGPAPHGPFARRARPAAAAAPPESSVSSLGADGRIRRTSGRSPESAAGPGPHREARHEALPVHVGPTARKVRRGRSPDAARRSQLRAIGDTRGAELLRTAAAGHAAAIPQAPGDRGRPQSSRTTLFGETSPGRRLAAA